MIATEGPNPKGALLRILGVSFGVAVTLGSTIGIGILRTPGTVAAQLGSIRLVVAIWIVGGVYALFGTLAVAELATMLPQAGGWYVYARRALGEYAGFTVGWINWVSFCSATASISIVIGEYVVRLVPALAGSTTETAVAVLLVFTLMHWRGVRLGSRAQEWMSFATASGFVTLILACFVFGGAVSRVNIEPGTSMAMAPAALVVALAMAFQSVIFTYDGWYGAIYFSEEDTDPTRHLPRAMIGGVLVVIVLFLLVNLAFLRVLPLAQLAASRLAAADAAQVVFGAHGDRLITALSLVSLLGVTNAAFMQTSRVLYGMSRDALFLPGVAVVNRRGTPTLALIIGTGVEILLVVSGNFERLLAMTAFFFVAMYSSGFVALFVLRVREPDWPRPFRAWGYPWTTAVAVVLSCLFLAGVVVSDPVNSLLAVTAVAMSYPLYLLVKWGREPLTTS